MSYIDDWDKVAGDGNTISTAQKAIIESQISLFLSATFGQDFVSGEATTDTPELHTIGSNQDFIIAKNFPIISVTELKDNVLATEPNELTEDEDFRVDKETGTINLIDAVDPIDGFVENNYFTQGVNTVSLAYTYGHVSLPSDIQNLCYMLASVLSKSINKSESSNNFEEIEMGDYRKKNGKASLGVSLYEDSLIKIFLPNLKSKYSNLVALGTKARD